MLKVMPWPWLSFSKQIWIRSFKWGTVRSCRSRGWKNIRGQSWRSIRKCWLSQIRAQCTRSVIPSHSWDSKNFQATWLYSKVFVLPKGLFTNYVMRFLLFFDHPPTHGNVLPIISLMTCHTRVCNSNPFADHPPTPTALRNMWTTPK